MQSLAQQQTRFKGSFAAGRSARPVRRLNVTCSAAVAQKSVSGTMSELKKQGK